MLRVFLLTIGLALSACLPAWAQDLSKADKENLEGSGELAATFARCAGYWTWFSEFNKRDGKPAVADYIRMYANGAYTSALWVLASEYALENQGGEPRTYGSFGELIDGPMEVERLRMTALEELDDIDAIKQQHASCEALTEGSEEIIKLIRQERNSGS